MIKISQGGNALTLRKIILVTLAFFVLSSFSGSPYSRINEANDLIGTYLNAEKDAKVRIFLAMNNKYSGKVEWMQEPNHPDGKPKLDTKNPNPEEGPSKTRTGHNEELRVQSIGKSLGRRNDL